MFFRLYNQLIIWLVLQGNRLLSGGTAEYHGLLLKMECLNTYLLSVMYRKLGIWENSGTQVLCKWTELIRTELFLAWWVQTPHYIILFWPVGIHLGLIGMKGCFRTMAIPEGYAERRSIGVGGWISGRTEWWIHVIATEHGNFSWLVTLPHVTVFHWMWCLRFIVN